MSTANVFLSHNSKDKPIVEALASKLLNNGIQPWLDKWNLVPGEPWQEAIEEALDTCSSCIVFIGENGIGPWQNEEMRSAIDRRIREKSIQFRVIPVLLPNIKRDNNWKLPAFLTRVTWVEFKNSIEEDEPFTLLLNGIIGVSPYPQKKNFIEEANERLKNYTKEIERLYTLLGATIEKHESSQSTNSFVALFKKGPIKFKLFVICLLKINDEIVNEDEVKNLFFYVEKAKQKDKFDKHIVVSNSEFSLNAITISSQLSLELINSRELYDQLVDFSNYVAGNINSYENTNLHSWFIEQTGSDIEDYELLDILNNKYLHSPLNAYIDKLVFDKGHRRIAILGNFGIGKTSFCLNYYYRLLLKYRNDPKNRIPIYINLRDFRSGFDIHQLLANHLQNQIGIDISLSLFIELQRLGRFIFILDSLDEMATKVDRVVINENLREIDRLFHECDNIYILSCRTHFFQEKITEDVLDDYKVVFITEWSNSELTSYLKKRFGSEWNNYYKSLHSISGLKELSRTPMLLEMVIKSLSDISDVKSINSAKLYEAYTNDWIVQQSKRKGAVMTKEQRRKFTLELSRKLYSESIYEIHFSSLHKIAEELAGHIDATRIDYFDTDARTSTFIVKSSDGHYGFRHTSFLEFFCASTIVDEINNEVSSLLSRKIIPFEVLSFIQNMNISSKGVIKLHEWSKLFNDNSLSRNSVAILRSKNLKIGKEVAEHYKVNIDDWDLYKQMIDDNDPKSFDLFYRRFYPKVFSFFKKTGHEVDDINDAFNDALIKLITRKNHPLVESVNLSAYIITIVRNILIDKKRSLNKRRTVAIEELDEFDIPNEVLDEENFKGDYLMNLLQKLPPKDREIIQLQLSSHTIDEMTKLLGFSSSSSTKTYLYKARMRLRQLYNEMQSQNK